VGSYELLAGLHTKGREQLVRRFWVGCMQRGGLRLERGNAFEERCLVGDDGGVDLGDDPRILPILRTQPARAREPTS
jgi:hypothetical protein